MSRAKKESRHVRGAIYARYSSHAQRDVSIEQQVKEDRAHAEKLGIEVVKVYADRAVSGKTDNRPEFQSMLRDAEKGLFDCVIAWKSNRIGRNMLQAMVNEARLSEMGVRVLYVEEDFDDTAAGRFALRSMMNVNQFYSENMAEDIRRGLRDNASRGMIAAGIPYGYKSGEDKRYELDPPKDAIVREIFEAVANGVPNVAIAASLNQRGITTRSGKAWGKHSFHSILENERYRGIYIYGDIRIENGMPRIISDELWFKAQEALKVKKAVKGRHSPNGDYLLTGKLFCGKCGSPMTGISGTSKSGATHYYYSCVKRRTDHSCDKANARRDAVELAVATAIREHILRDDVIDWLADQTVLRNKKLQEENHLSMLEDSLLDVNRSIRNMMTAIEQGIITETTKERLLELEAERDKLRGKIAAARAEVIDLPKEYIVEGLKMFRDGNVHSKAYQAKLFDVFLVAVYLYDDKLRIVFNFSGDKSGVIVKLPSDFNSSDGDGTDIECSYNVPKGVLSNRRTLRQMRSSVFV